MNIDKHEVKDEAPSDEFKETLRMLKSTPNTDVIEFTKSWIKRCVVPEIIYQLDQYRKHPLDNQTGYIEVKVIMNTKQHPEVSRMQWCDISTIVSEWLCDGVSCENLTNDDIFTFKLKLD